MKKDLPPKSTVRKILNFLIIAFYFMILVGVVLGPTNSHGPVVETAAMMTSRTIGQCLQQYAVEHNGHYPDGKTSTEVFQHLIDEKYVTDPAIFYFRYGNMIPGKTEPLTDQLKPENVTWDVTCCVDSSAPNGLPLVFLSGYKITYQAGARAVPIVPATPHPPRTWVQWWNGEVIRKPFIAVCYKDNSARAMNADDDGSIPNFIPADFDPKGKVYRQLTP